MTFWMQKCNYLTIKKCLAVKRIDIPCYEHQNTLSLCFVNFDAQRLKNIMFLSKQQSFDV